MATTNFQTVDEYIASFPRDIQVALESVRRMIQEAAPGAEEKISYQMPAFALDGPLVYYSAWKKHIGLYGVSGALKAFKDEVEPYLAAKGTLRFPLNKPMPLALIGDIVKYEVEENAAKRKAK